MKHLKVRNSIVRNQNFDHFRTTINEQKENPSIICDPTTSKFNSSRQDLFLEQLGFLSACGYWMFQAILNEEP
jgi:hypothetical protein